jgi:hypothetical protein
MNNLTREVQFRQVLSSLINVAAIATFTIPCLSICFAQTDTSKEKAALPAESGEHLYARHEYARVLAVVVKWGGSEAERAPYLAAIARFAADPYNPETYIEWPWIEAVEPRITLLRVRMNTADRCARVYRDTIDKKQSDLTTREADEIRACQSLDLYPPPTT